MKDIEIKQYLTDLNNRNSFSERQNEFSKMLKELKQQFVKKNDQEHAKEVWCFEQILNIQNNYLLAFKDLKNHEFYNAWRRFEEIEINLFHLKPHFKEKNNEFYLQFISEYIKKFQSLYPYKIFISTEEVIKEKKCSICGKKVTLRSHCGHEAGEIYNGEMCCREITSIDVVGVSLVYNPARKYSVAFPKTNNGTDPFKYNSLKYLIKFLESPFEKWDYKWTKKRHPHKFFTDIKPNDKCPCDSGKQYIDCCMKEEGVLRPHCQFYFYKKKKRNFDLEYVY